MNSLLSALSGGFGKSLLLSTLLPVVVFVLLALVLVLPCVPGTLAFVSWERGLDAEWKLAAVTLAVVLLTAILHNLNGPVIRFYEGYPWCDSWLGRWRTRAHRRKLEEAQLQWQGLRGLLALNEAKAQPGHARLTAHWNAIARILNVRYPDDPETVLPTRLGNVIRSFESYPWRQYRIRAITLWPRLAAVLDAGFAAMLDDAKASLDFMLNSSLLSLSLAALLAVVHLVFPIGLARADVLMPVGIEVVLLAGLSYFFYLAAIARANAWGLLVKSAFDLHRGKLLEGLGYRFHPDSLEKERALWADISKQLILSDLTIDPLPPWNAPKTAATRATAKPKDLELALLRGTRRPADGSLEVTIEVRNKDAAREATRLAVVDTLPEVWAYEWGSAAASTGPVEVTGANPYRFEIAALAPRGVVTVTYRAVAAAPPAAP